MLLSGSKRPLVYGGRDMQTGHNPVNLVNDETVRALEYSKDLKC